MNFDKILFSELLEFAPIQGVEMEGSGADQKVKTIEKNIASKADRTSVEKGIDEVLNSSIENKEAAVVLSLYNSFKSTEEGGILTTNEFSKYQQRVNGEFKNVNKQKQIDNPSLLSQLATSTGIVFNSNNGADIVRKRLHQLGYHDTKGEIINENGGLDKDFLFAVGEFQTTCTFYKEGAKREYSGSNKIDCIPGKVTLQALLEGDAICPPYGKPLKDLIALGEEVISLKNEIPGNPGAETEVAADKQAKETRLDSKALTLAQTVGVEYDNDKNVFKYKDQTKPRETDEQALMARKTDLDKPTEQPIVEPENDPNIDLVESPLTSLEVNAAGYISGRTQGQDYYLRVGSRWRKLNDEEKNAPFEDGQQIALSKNPKANEILTVVKQKQQGLGGGEELVKEPLGANVILNTGTVNKISSGAYEREQTVKHDYFKKSFPELDVSNYNDSKESGKLSAFVEEHITSVIIDPKLPLESKIAIVKNIVSQLNDPNLNRENRLPSGIDANGKVIFDGNKLNQKKLIIFNRRNQKNEKIQYYALMDNYQNQIIYHINKTNAGIYTQNLEDPNYYNPKNAELSAGREKFKNTNTLELATRDKLQSWYVEYNDINFKLGEVITRDNTLNTQLTNNAFGNNLIAMTNAQSERVQLMKSRIQYESNLLLLGKKINYLQGNTTLVDESNALAQLEKLKTDADNLINGVKKFIEKNGEESSIKDQIAVLNTNIGQLETFINNESADASKPSLVDAKYLYEKTGPDLTTLSITITQAQAEINRLTKDLNQFQLQISQLSPGDPQYVNKRDKLNTNITQTMEAIRKEDQIIADTNVSYNEKVNELENNVAKEHYNSLKSAQGLLLPLATPNPVLQVQTDVATIYDEKQQTVATWMDENIKTESNKQVATDKREAVKQSKEQLAGEIETLDSGIEAAQAIVNQEQKKINKKDQTVDTELMLTNQDIVLTKNREKQQKIADYNTLHYENVVTYQQELYVEKQYIDAYKEHTQKNVDHLDAHAKQLQGAINERVGKFNSIKAVYAQLLEKPYVENTTDIHYHTQELNNLKEEAKRVYTDLMGSDAGINRDNFSKATNLTSADLYTKTGLTTGLVFEYQDVNNILTQEKARLAKRTLLSDYQQSRIDLIGIQAQADMMKSNIEGWEKYITDVLRKQIDDNLKSVKFLEEQNQTLASTNVPDIQIAENQAKINQNNSDIQALKRRNIQIEEQIASINTEIGDKNKPESAKGRLEAILSKQTLLEGQRTSRKQALDANTTKVFIDPNDVVEFQLSADPQIPYEKYTENG